MTKIQNSKQKFGAFEFRNFNLFRISDFDFRIFLFIFYSITLFLLAIYSYSQIDLNLTLSSFSLYQAFQQKLIQLGYFNRPLSALVYLILIFLLFILYLLSLYLAKKSKLTSKDLLVLILLTTGILFLSYPAFSHDLFNYMFDARIVTKYHLNPYFYKALNFPGDLWIRFMHWTHRTYPYGPFWILITLPFSFFGFGKFVLTLFNFKLMFAAFHLGNIYFIWKIVNKNNKGKAVLATIFYALNPLILIESQVSPHNEVMMLFFLLLTIYLLYIKQRFISAIVSLVVSSGIKFASVIVFPVVIYVAYRKRKIDTGTIIYLILFVLIIPLVVQINLREPFPWYFIPAIGIVSLNLTTNLAILLTGISLAALLRYAPFLFEGSYPNWVSNLQNWLFVIPLAISIGVIGIRLAKDMARIKAKS